MMIDLVALQAIADAGEPDSAVGITRRTLRQMIREIEQGRARAKRRDLADEAMTNGQQQLDAVINNIRYEGGIGDRRQPDGLTFNICDALLDDAGDAD